MLCCRDAARLASKHRDAPLTLGERWSLWLHLRACEGCRRFREQVRRLGEWVRPGAGDLEGLADVALTAEEQEALARAMAAEPENP